MRLKTSRCVATSSGHSKRIMWLNRPELFGLWWRKERLLNHNALMKRRLQLKALTEAFNSLFAVWLMAKWGWRSMPALPNEPQKGLPDLTLARLQPSETVFQPDTQPLVHISYSWSISHNTHDMPPISIIDQYFDQDVALGAKLA